MLLPGPAVIGVALPPASCISNIIAPCLCRADFSRYQVRPYGRVAAGRGQPRSTEQPRAACRGWQGIGMERWQPGAGRMQLPMVAMGRAGATAAAAASDWQPS